MAKSQDKVDMTIFATRVVLGLIFFLAGLSKVMGIDGFVGMLSIFGPLAVFLAWVVAIVELLGGLALILGVYTRWAAIPLGIIMIVAILMKLFVLGQASWNAVRFDLLMLVGLKLLYFAGSGKWAVMNK